MPSLVLVHGRAQEHKDAGRLKHDWLAALRLGLSRQGLDLPIGEEDVRFPYYGQTLFDLISGDPGEAAAVIVRGDVTDEAEREFTREVFAEVLAEAGVTDADVRAIAGDDVAERGPQNWRWVRAALQALDAKVPGASSATIALVTRDVFQYLRNPGLRDVIEKGVRSALRPGEPTVVVAHSLGTVVAYNLLRREGVAQGWEVPLLLTLGSPLGVGAIARALQPLERPAGVSGWFNAYDKDDIVALHPLDGDHFPVQPPVDNWDGVQNTTPNQHGISGYLDDRRVARTIYDALST